MKILKRENNSNLPTFCFERRDRPILYPKLPYHKRLEIYLEKRDKIFNSPTMEKSARPKTKRSTLRLRNFVKKKKLCRKLLVSTIVSDPKDMRYYAKVNFLDFVEYGLLDTGANISCIGSDLARTNFSHLPDFVKCKSHVNTADGNSQVVLGFINTDVTFRQQTKLLKLFIIPSLAHRVILGIDFWKSFNLCPELVESSDILVFNNITNSLSVLSSLTDSKILSDEVKSPNDLDHSYPITIDQRQQLDAVINLFPNFEKQGLGRTSLIQHSIDVGNATPIKQRFYPVSPAVEKVMFKEVDRMLELGVIEASASPWSSPMRLVVKPNKVRLCLDARKVNQVTKKDA